MMFATTKTTTTAAMARAHHIFYPKLHFMLNMMPCPISPN